MDMTIRPRRLRGKRYTQKNGERDEEWIESSLIYPMFVKEGNDIREEIPSMDGQYRYSVDCMGFELERLLNRRCEKCDVLASRIRKDEVGSGAYNENGIVQRALREAKEKFPELYLITDVCMCEYTSTRTLRHVIADTMWTMIGRWICFAKTALSHVWKPEQIW